MYYQNADAEILLLGNSRGLMFYQPEVEKLTNKKSFNFSYNGMPIQMGSALVKDYLDKYEKPEILLVDITCADRNNAALIAGMSAYAPVSQRLQDLIQEVNPTAAGAAKLTHLFRYNSEIWQRAMRYIKGSDETWLNDREINQFMIDKATVEKPLDFTFSSEKELNPADLMNNIKSLVNYAKSKDIKVRLVVNPYYPPFFNRSNGFENWKDNVEKIVGQKVNDYSTALNDPKYFTDYQHCNKLGSIEYLKLLKRDGLLD